MHIIEEKPVIRKFIDHRGSWRQGWNILRKISVKAYDNYNPPYYGICIETANYMSWNYNTLCRILEMPDNYLESKVIQYCGEVAIWNKDSGTRHIKFYDKALANQFLIGIIEPILKKFKEA